MLRRQYNTPESSSTLSILPPVETRQWACFVRPLAINHKSTGRLIYWGTMASRAPQSMELGSFGPHCCCGCMGHSPERRAAVISKLDGAQPPKVQVCVAYTGQVFTDSGAISGFCAATRPLLLNKTGPSLPTSSSPSGQSHSQTPRPELPLTSHSPDFTVHGMELMDCFRFSSSCSSGYLLLSIGCLGWRFHGRLPELLTNPND